jgi:RsiW-degrading membrane proteinase PrsW (M82 family)
MDITLAITIGIPLLIVAYIVKSDKFPEPSGLIVKTFLMGVFLCFPAGWLNGYLIWNQENPDNYSFLAGLTEESLKFLALYLYIKPKGAFNEPMDAIVYGITISLGFAAWENLEYVYLYNEDISSLSVAIIRAISAIPLHASCGIIMGYFFGLYIFKGAKVYIYQALIIPICIHAFYNFLAGLGNLIFFPYLFLVIFFALRMHKELITLQKNKKFEAERKVN